MTELKLSKRTYSILKNFSLINQGMLFRPGHVLRTVAKDKNMFGVAEVDETFPIKFGIGDLSKFLSVVDLYDSPEINVEDDKRLVIKGQNNRKFVYTLAPEKSILTLEDKPINMPDTLAEFKLTAADLVAIKKNVSVGNLSEVVFVADGDHLYVKGLVSTNPTSDQYTAELGSTDQHFNILFAQWKITNMMEFDYRVTVSKLIARFATDNLTYYAAPELGSRYD